MKIAALQLNLVVGDIKGNSRRLVEAVRLAAEAGAELCLSTELAICGYPPKDLLLYEDFVSACLAEAEAMARQLSGLPPLLLGCPLTSCLERGKPLHNGAILLRGGAIEQTFGKRLLPTYEVFDETRYFEPWDGPSTFEHEGLRFGVTICEDIWNDPEFIPRRLYSVNPVQIAKSEGAQVLLNLSASPLAIGKQRFREKMVGGMARKNTFPIMYANQVGGNDDLVFDGRSLCFDGEGRCQARARGFSEDVLLVDLDLKIGGRIEPDVASVEEEIWSALVLATRDYAHKCGFREAVLGLSGGIDSALTAAVAAEALGAENVLGVLLPSPYSSTGSIDDSLLFAEGLGIRTMILPIEEIMLSYERTLAQVFAGCSPDVTEENIQSRIRGNLLMALSNKFGKLLLTTGNKSELAVGYCTIYGDMSGGFAVISDVPKTMVYSLCIWLNGHRGKSVIPASIIEKAPSAELRPGQKDQDSLPPYPILDDLLDGLVERRISSRSLQNKDAGEFSGKMVGMLQRAEFKRQQAAPGPKIFANAFGSGWRMPIASVWNI